MGDYTHLSMFDRRRFYTFLEMGLTITEIAKRLAKHRSTVYRELKRNSSRKGYLPKTAQLKMEERAKQKRSSKLQKEGILRDYVVRGLEKGWSPEQIAGRMKHQKRNFYACHETINQFIYQSKNKALYHCLPYRKPKRQKRCGRRKRFCRYGGMRLITQRPEAISTRKRLGHWEGDTIEFKGTKEKVVTTLVERKSRTVFLIKNNTKHSRGVMEQIKRKLDPFPSKICKTITFDQGYEFADYRFLEQQLACKVYYCQTRSPWQKGSNENMNGRLRWYLPRETDIARITQDDLDQLAIKMNRCPRKCLGYKTPNEVFIK